MCFYWLKQIELSIHPHPISINLAALFLMKSKSLIDSHVWVMTSIFTVFFSFQESLKKTLNIVKLWGGPDNKMLKVL